MKRFPITALFILAIFAAASTRAFADDAALADKWALQLAKNLETAFNTRDIPAGDATFDMDAFIDRITTGVNAPASYADAFRTSLKKKSILGAMLENSQNAGSWRFLRIRSVDGEPRALYRILRARGGVNYIEWVLGKDAQGTPKFVDAYNAITGELMSQAIRRTYVAGAAEVNLGLANTLTGSEKDVATFAAKVSKFTHDMQTAKYADAIDDYKALPVLFQQNKAFLSMRLLAAGHLQNIRPQEYTDALADFQTSYPNDPSLDLVGLDALVHEKKFDEAHQALDRLQTFTGGDAYLQYLHGSIDMSQGGDDRFTDAQKQFQDAIATEPTLKPPYWGLVTLSLKTKDFDQTAEMLDEIHQTFHTRFGNLEKLPLYAEFVQSDAYKKWKAEQTPVKTPNPG